MLVLDARSLRVSRAIARAPRVCLAAACVVLMLAGARSTFRTAPPPAQAQTSTTATRDIAAEALAEQFARTYLEWDDTNAAEALSRFGPDLEPPDVPAGIEQHVEWTSVASAEKATSAVIVTIAAATTRGRYDLAVPIGRGRKGMRFVLRDPAIVGAIPTAAPPSERPAREVEDAELTAVARRALKNYLARDQADLSADLDNAAVVVLPDQEARMTTVDRLDWAIPRRRVDATVRARFAGGVELTLRYDLPVVRRAGRWLVRAVNTNPTSEVHP